MRERGHTKKRKNSIWDGGNYVRERGHTKKRKNSINKSNLSSLPMSPFVILERVSTSLDMI